MATKKKRSSKRTAEPQRKRRTDEELLAAAEEQLEALLERKSAKELKQSTAIRKSMAAVRALKSALDAAADEQNTPLRHALADGYRPLARHLGNLGVRVPKVNLPRGRRPRTATEA